MPAIVDLKESAPVTAVADDVPAGVCSGSAGLLGGNRGE
jgi:hypothetical protein